jgi:SOS-response transcriptional repressor LexA
LYSLKAACGAFGEWQTVEENGWIKAEGVGKLNRSMFVVQAVGHSMEPRIMDGDFCVFRANVVGSRYNKIVLVQHNDHYDAENEGSYSIKKYTSQKIYDKDTGEWMHERIILQPINPTYEPIKIENEDGFMVIGEFIEVVI